MLQIRGDWLNLEWCTWRTVYCMLSLVGAEEDICCGTTVGLIVLNAALCFQEDSLALAIILPIFALFFFDTPFLVVVFLNQ